MTKEGKKSVLIEEKLQFIAELSRTSAWIGNRYTEFLKPYGISPQQLNVLRVLRTADDWLAMNRINELLIVKSPNVTRLVDKLVAKEMVRRDRSSEDRRVVYVKITNVGMDLLSQIDQQHEGEVSDYMDRFTLEDAVSFRKLLMQIRA